MLESVELREVQGMRVDLPRVRNFEGRAEGGALCLFGVRSIGGGTVASPAEQ